MLDRNPLHDPRDPNDSAFVACVTDYLYGDIGDYADRVMSQIATNKITARFGMIALSGLEIQRRRQHRRKIQGLLAPQTENATSAL